MNQRETAKAVDNNRIAASRESMGMGALPAMSASVTMANMREPSPKIIVERSRFIARCEFVGAASLAFGSLVLFLAVVFNQIERDLAILMSAALLILNAIDKPTSKLTDNETDPDSDEIFMEDESATGPAHGQGKRRVS